MRRSRFVNSLARVLICPCLLVAQSAIAQMPPHLPPAGQLQLQIAQPRVDTTSPVRAAAEFDPPIARAGDKICYRVNVDATESSIVWPDVLPVPPGLRFGADTRGMTTQMQASSFRPLTAFVYEVLASKTGRFTVSNFTVNVSGAPVNIPAATLQVISANAPLPTGLPVPRQVQLELSETNVFLGEPFRARVVLPPGPNNAVEALHDIQLNGDGLMMDKTALRQTIQAVNVDGQIRTAFVCELVVTPIAAGTLKLTAQGFTAGREFTAPIVISGPANLFGGPARYVLLVSDPKEIHVRPLPLDGELPGYTGAIGRFYMDPPQLSTNRLKVGEPVALKVQFHGEGDLSRFAPPMAPRSRDWQIIADPPPSTSFTLIPLTDETLETPAIPFSYFDPVSAKYEDLSIAPIPVTIVGEGLPTELSTVDEAGNAAPPVRISAPATAPGLSVSSLKPLQMRSWFPSLQLLPAITFIALWRWDRRRRFLEAHPEIVRRLRARRALRREKQLLEKAALANDGARYVRHAARAMSIASAPHLAADPRALVASDVLTQLDEPARTGQAGETVKRIFSAADSQFAGTPQVPPDVGGLRAGVQSVLQRLEERL